MLYVIYSDAWFGVTYIYSVYSLNTAHSLINHMTCNVTSMFKSNIEM